MRNLLAALCLLLTVSGAHAQTGSPKTQAALNTEIGTTGCTLPTCLYPDAPAGAITAFGLRQGLLDLTATLFSGGGVPVNGPATTTVGDFAVWNNTTGTLLTDVAPGTGVGTAFILPVNATGGLLSYAIIGTTGATVPLNNGGFTQSGTANFTGTFELGGTTVVLPIGVPNGGTGVATLATGEPLFGAGTAAITTGTLSGNTTVLATTTGSLTNGHCVAIDSSGNLIDAGGACTTGGGGGTVSSATAGQLAYYATSGTTVAGLTLGTNLSITGTTLNAASSGVTSVGAATGAILLGTGLTISSQTINTPWTISGSNIYNNNAGNVGIGTTTPAFDGNTSQFFSVADGTAHAFAEVGLGGNATSAGDFVGSLAFYNSSLGTTDKRIAGIQTQTVGATNSGEMQFFVYNAGSAKDSLLMLPSSETQESAFRGYADLRFWSTLACNVASPSSTNVAAAMWAANVAGWTRFFIPAGCYWDTSQNSGVSSGAWTNYNVPANFTVAGENWTQSGITTGGVSQVLTLGANTELINLFDQDSNCYNLDSGVYGNPAMCPIGDTRYGGAGNFAWYPFQSSFQYCVQRTIPAFGGNPAIGGFVDQPCFGIQTNSGGDDLFLSQGSGNAAYNLINGFGNGGAVFVVKASGLTYFGNSSTSHAGGSLSIQDSVGTCVAFSASSGAPGWACSSDARLKDNIHDTGDSLDWLGSFRIRDFLYKGDGKKHTGVIAQELQVNHPDMVHESDRMDPHCDCKPLLAGTPNEWKLVKVMQEMQAEIVALQQKVHQ